MAYIITNQCKACGKCTGACPGEAIVEGEMYHIDSEKCLECGACVPYCPAGAIVEQ